jgi:hypothetical protein
MNYYELKKRATPGPYCVLGGDMTKVSGRQPILIRMNTWDCLTDERVLPKHRVNTQGHLLAAHCQRNFDKALSELKGLELILREDLCLKARLDVTRRVIDELETVEE